MTTRFSLATLNLPFISLCAAVLALACSPLDDEGVKGGLPDAGTAPADGGVDTSNEGLTQFVADGGYLGQGWRAEPTVHPDRGGPHGMVRIYFNEVLFQSLKAGNTLHPRGSMVLKETYSADGQTLRGHMIDLKDVDASGNDQWVWWYRPSSTSGTAPTYFRGTNNYCASCHAAGVDFVRAAAP